MCSMAVTLPPPLVEIMHAMAAAMNPLPEPTSRAADPGFRRDARISRLTACTWDDVGG